MKAWFRFFRIVNLPTVPGDLLVGSSALLAGGLVKWNGWGSLVAACCAAMALYLFGMADNDIVGAKTDVGRPIPEGAISIRAARLARGMCLFAALVAGAAANLPPAWWIAAFALVVSAVAYNRLKSCFLIGLCRGLDVWCGGVAILACNFRGIPDRARLALFVVAAIWTLYIALVTKYSEGEAADPEKRRRVGLLIGGIVYLQLLALVFFCVKPLIIAGAVLLVVLRFTKRLLPGVSAS